MYIIPREYKCPIMNNQNFITSCWYDVRKFLPGNSEWKIVRCIDERREFGFYFMAYYYLEINNWEFFDEEYKGVMQVTHWADEIKVEKEHEFNLLMQPMEEDEHD